MKNGSKFLKLVLVGALGAAVMIGCSDDRPYAGTTWDENGCRNKYNEDTDVLEEICDGPAAVSPSDDTVPEDETTTTVEETTTTVEETTTTVDEAPTTVPRPTTTVKKTTAATAPPTNAPATQVPTTVPTTTTTAPTTTTTTTPTTTATTTTPPPTAPPVTLPAVNVRAGWSGSNTGCPSLYPGSITLDVIVTGGTSPQVSVSVQGNSVSQPGPSYVNGAEESFWFSGFPSSLPDGSYTVNISVSDSGHATTNLSETVVYDCV
jgi:hypothetical protein